ncbi:DUF6279 family lipoprotein [Microbulbifer aggregans]|uniref:DUF6279 family lipoprotein n=1 Tax=Microbulbifer aggregans TaxID=1769779 RepID=UPI001CFC9972|nr:DUF6279 family lipoprotein [Microbulbifer aggregans]
MDRKINSYLDLEGAQKELLQQRVDDFHRWHRQTQLPRYADFFEQLATEVEDTSQIPERLKRIEKQVDEFWDNSVTMLSDLVLPLIYDLNAQQIDQLEVNIEEEREKSLKKWDRAQRKREKEFRKQTERWLGDLTEEQEEMIDRQVASSTFDPKLRDAQRQLWAATFISTLRKKPAGYQKQLRALVLEPQSLWSEDYQKMHDELRAQATALAQQIATSATTVQRQHLKATLQEYAADFRALANEAE